MNSGRLRIACGLLLCTAILVRPALPQGSPSEVKPGGISATAILSFIERLEKEVDAVHSFMILRHGEIVSQGWWAPYRAESPHVMHSLSKSFTSTAIGLAIAEGKLSLDDRVISFFPDLAPENPSWQLKAMRVRDLITMTTGHRQEPRLFTEKSDWVRVFLHSEVDFKPGTHFQYNSAATYMLSAILQKVTGEKLVDYLDSRLFRPLEIKKPDWALCPDGVNTGGWGLCITTEGVAKLGQLYLQRGMWQGRRILSEAWVDQATSKQTSNGSNPDSDWDQGYGFQFWRCRHHCYRGDGAFGQFCIVMPEHDAVVAITSGANRMGAVMDIVWETLLPAMQSAPEKLDDGASEALAQKLQQLSLPPVQGKASSPLSEQLRGQKFRFPENQAGIKSACFDLHGEAHRISMEMEHGTETVRIGTDEYLAGKMEHPLPHTQNLRHEIGASGAWVKPDQYQVKIYLCQTPASIVYTFRFKAGALTWQSELRHSLFGPREPEVLEGNVE